MTKWLKLKMSVTSLSESDLLYLWVKRNRGECSRIAKEFGFSPQFVRAVLYGHSGSTDKLIEKALIKAGAPVIQQRIEASA